MAVIALIIVVPGDAGATGVAMDIDMDMTWSPSNNPFVILDDIAVIDAELTILPGVQVEFNGPYHIACQGGGRIVARGTGDDPICITSSNAASYYFDYIQTGAGGVFTNCTMSYGTRGLILQSGAIVSDSGFSWSDQGARIDGQGILLERCFFDNCDVAVQLASSVDCRIVGTAFQYCRVGVNASGSGGRCEVSRSSFAQGSYRWFHMSVFHGTLEVSDSSFEWSETCFSLEEVDRVVVRGCRFYKNMHAVSLIACQANESSQHLIQGSQFRSNAWGLVLSQVDWASVSENTFRECGQALSYLAPYHPPTNVTFWRNNLLWNQKDGSFQSGNVTYHKDGSGNYWTRYSGEDADSDGIGDTPLRIHDDVFDMFPLMEPVDLADPTAEAGEDIEVDQREGFILDGGDSIDDLWIANWTWTIDLVDSTLTSYGETVATAVDAAGEFNVVLVVRDVVGKTSSDSLLLIVHDIDPPSIEDIVAPAIATTGETFTIDCTVSDNTDVKDVWVVVRFGSGGSKRSNMTRTSPGTWSVDVTVPDSFVGTLTYSIGAVDVHTNIHSTGYRSIAVVDNDPPVILPAIAGNATTGDAFSLICKIIDNIGVRNASVDLWADGSDLVSSMMEQDGTMWSAIVTIPPYIDGPVHLVFIAFDTAGNKGSSGTLTLPVIDNDPPSIELLSTSPAIGYWRKGDDVTVNATVTDNRGIAEAYVEYRYYSTEWERVPIAPEGPLFTGVLPLSSELGNMLWFRIGAVDGAGNSLVTEDRQVELRSMAPEITSVPPCEAFKLMPYRLDLEATDPDSPSSSLSWSLSTNATWLSLEEGTGTLVGTPAFEDIGWYWVELKVDDGEGGNDTLDFVLTVRDLNYPPVVTIKSHENGTEVRGKVLITGRATDDADGVQWVKVRVDGGEWEYAEGTDAWSYTLRTGRLKAGVHTIEVVASDGEEDSDLATLTLKVLADSDDGTPGFLAPLVIVALVSSLIVLKHGRVRLY